MKNPLLNLKPVLRFQYSDDPDVTAFAMLTGPDGKFINFSVDREMAYTMLTEMAYHLRRQEERKVDADQKF